MEKDLDLNGLIDEELIAKMVEKKVSSAIDKGANKAKNKTKKQAIKIEEINAVVGQVNVTNADKVANDTITQIKDAIDDETKTPIETKVKIKTTADVDISTSKSTKKQAEQVTNEIQNIVQNAMSNHKEKWKNFDLLGELGKVKLNTSDLEKQLDKLYNSDSFGGDKANKKFVAMYSAYKSLGGKIINDYEFEINRLLDETLVRQDLGLLSGEKTPTREKNDIEFYNTLFDTVKELIPLLNDVNTEVEKTQKTIDKPKKKEQKKSSESNSETAKEVVQAESKKQKATKETRKQIDYEKASVEELIDAYKKSEKALKSSKKQETIDYHNSVISGAGSALESKGYSLTNGSWNKNGILSGDKSGVLLGDNTQPIIDDKKEVPHIDNVKEAVNELLVDVKGLKHYTDEVFDSFNSSMFGSGIGENRLGNAAYFFDEKNMGDWQNIGEYSKYLTTWSAKQVKLFDQTMGFTEEQIEHIIKEFYSDIDEDMQNDYKFSFKNMFKDMDLYEFESMFNIKLEDVMKSLNYDGIKSTNGEYAFYNTDKLVREVQVYDNEAKKFIDINSKVAESRKELSSQSDKTEVLSGEKIEVPSPDDSDIKQWKEYCEAIALGLERIERIQKLKDAGVTNPDVLYKMASMRGDLFNALDDKDFKTAQDNPEKLKDYLYWSFDKMFPTDELKTAFRQKLSEIFNIDATSLGFAKGLNGAAQGNGYWTHFATYDNATKKRTDSFEGDYTYKLYGTFKDIADLNKDTISSIMRALTDAGFKGQLKVPGYSGADSRAVSSDQIVIHGNNVDMQEIAYKVLREQFSEMFSFVSGGFDSKDGSFSEILSGQTHDSKSIKIDTDSVLAASKEIFAQRNQENQATRDAISLEQDLAKARQQEVNQTPLSSDSKVSEEAKETAKEIEKADEQIEESNEEVKQSEEKLTQTTTESRQKSSSAAKEHADEVVKANERIVESNKEVVASENNIDTSGNDAKPETNKMGKVAIATEEAVQSKKDFTTANEGVQDSVDSSKSKLQLEAELMESIAKNAHDAAKSKKDFVKANKDVEKSADSSSDSLKDEKKNIDGVKDSSEQAEKNIDDIVFKPNTEGFDEIISKLGIIKERADEISKITKSSIWKGDKYEESYNIKYKDGSSEIRGESSSKGGSNILRANEVAYDSNKEAKLLEINKQQSKWEAFQKEQEDYSVEQNKKTYQELIDTIQKYEKVKKRIANEKHLEGDIELADKLEEKIYNLQKQPILSSSELEKSEKQLENIYDDLIEIEKKNSPTVKNLKQAEKIENKKIDADKILSLARSDKGDTSEFEKVLKITTDIINLQGEYTKEVNGSAESMDKLDKAATDFKENFVKDFGIHKDKILEGFNLTFKRITNDKNFGSADAVTKDTLEKNLKALEEFTLGDNIEEDARALVDIINQINNGIRELKAVPKENLLPDASELNKDLGNINKVLAGGYKMSGQLRQSYKALQKAYEDAFDSNGNVKVTNKELQNLRDTLSKLNAEFEATGKKKSLFGSFGQRLTDMNTKFLAQYFSFQDFIRYGRQAFETIKEYDSALTEMNKVSKESIQTLKEFQQESFKLADSVGTTASQIQNSTADFLRLGETFEQAKQSAQDANALFKVSEFESINEATDALISMSQAYKELEKSEINDILNYVGNNFSLSTSDLASALQDAAAVLKTQGNSIYEAVALITAGNAVTQDPLKTAGGVRTISLRIAGTEEAKAELESLGESVDDYIVQTESKTQQTIKNLTAVASNAGKGIDVLDANGNLRNTYDILLDISKIYKEIQEEDKKAGTNRANALVEYIAGEIFCLKFVETHFYRTHLIALIA